MSSSVISKVGARVPRVGWVVVCSTNSDFFFFISARIFAGFRKVEGGDLETVEDQARASRVEGVVGDALQDFADGGLDGGAVFWNGQGEAGSPTASALWVLDWFAGGVVVVAEFFLAECGALAAASVGEDVAALVAFWFWLFGHGVDPPPRGLLRKVL